MLAIHAKALGLTVLVSLLGCADKVIERTGGRHVGLGSWD
jgi:hypothetical protein